MAGWDITAEENVFDEWPFYHTEPEQWSIMCYCTHYVINLPFRSNADTTDRPLWKAGSTWREKVQQDGVAAGRSFRLKTRWWRAALASLCVVEGVCWAEGPEMKCCTSESFNNVTSNYSSHKIKKKKRTNYYNCLVLLVKAMQRIRKLHKSIVTVQCCY